jgi:hypothetical protein
MNRTRECIALPVFLAAMATAAWAADYADFASLSEREKSKLVWELHERKEWGLPEQKPICRDILANQGYFANATAWTSDAIALAEKQAWNDLTPLISKIYEAPRDIWIYESAFAYLRRASGKSIPRSLIENMETLRAAGYYESTVTDTHLQQAKQRLTRQSDKEAILVYAIGIAGWHAGKGGNSRGREAAVDVLLGLKHQDVASRLRQLHRNCESYMRDQIEWLAKRVNVELTNTTPNQPAKDAVRKPADPQP